MNPTVSRNSTIRMNPTVQNSHTVTDQFNSLDQTNPISWGGGVTGGQKDEWVWLVGSEPLGLSVLQEKPGHSTESRREGEAERKDRKWGLKVTQRGRAMFKKKKQKNQKPIFITFRQDWPSSKRKTFTNSPGKSSTGQVHQGYMTRIVKLLIDGQASPLTCDAASIDHKLIF